MLPLSMPVSNSATALLSTSRAGIAKFDLGAEVTSKHITICEVLWQEVRGKITWARNTYNYREHLGTGKIRAEELKVWRACLASFRATLDQSERRAVESHDRETISMSERIEGILAKSLRKICTVDVQ
jgi:hypothetical protein